MGKKKTAERVGFEPTVALAHYNDFRDRPIKPLWHLSIRRIINQPAPQARAQTTSYPKTHIPFPQLPV